MQAVPLLHIIFYLTILFMPKGTTEFTVSSGYDQKVTWVRKPDGAWHATTDSGKDAGVWSADGLSVSVLDHSTTNQTDLSTFLKIGNPAERQKQATLGGRPVSTAMTGSSITFSQGKDGTLFKPVVVTYSTK